MSIYYNQFLDNFEKNPTSLDNGTLINNICHIYYSPTIEIPAPTTRPDESALVTGDLWYNPNTGIQGFWNGTYWIGKKGGIAGAFTFIGTNENFINQNNTITGCKNFNGLFIKELNLVYRKNLVGGTTDATNYFSPNFSFRGGRNQIDNGFPDLSYSFNLNGIDYPLATTEKKTINVPIDQAITWNDITPLTANVLKVGSPTMYLDCCYSLLVYQIL